MRSLIATAVTATVLTLPTAPANAEGALVMRCWLRYGSPAGTTSGNGSCNAYGVVNGLILRDAPFSMTFSAQNYCPTQTATGSLTGSGVTIAFTWSRVLTTGVISTSGAVTGVGEVYFHQPCPISGEVMVFTIGG